MGRCSRKLRGALRWPFHGWRWIPTRRALAVCAVLGALFTYGSTWVGPAAFYLDFQRRIERHAVGAEGGILWSVPVAVALERPPAWEYRAAAGLLVPAPPGRLLRTERRGLLTTLHFEEGCVQYRRFPKGLVGDIFRVRLRELGGGAGELPGEVELLGQIAATHPDSFRMAWPTAERHRYAARVLSKLSLWHDQPVRRFEMCLRPSPRGTSILAEYEEGLATVLVVTDEYALVVVLPPGIPAEWKSSPALWFPKDGCGQAGDTCGAEDR